MRIKGSYHIKKISYKDAMKIVIENHYLHRRCPCSFAFGLFDINEEIKGVICYGTPFSSTLRRGIAGASNSSNVIELTRLWINDSVPKNGASFLIGNTINLIDKEIVVSFAEIDEGHIGTVYQATNWYYTGLSAKRSNWVVEGIKKHSQTLADKYTSAQIRELYGERFKIVERPRKHRYIYLNCNKWRRKEILKELIYPILPYPKDWMNYIPTFERGKVPKDASGIRTPEDLLRIIKKGDSFKDDYRGFIRLLLDSD